jgi:hypothetical protein
MTDGLHAAADWAIGSIVRLVLSADADVNERVIATVCCRIVSNSSSTEGGRAFVLESHPSRTRLITV